MVTNSKNQLLSKPLISTKGFFDNSLINLFKKSMNSRISSIFNEDSKNKKFNENQVKEKIESFSKKFFRKSLDTRPLLEIHIL